MSIKKIQPKHLAHAVMLAFASASLFNIAAFFTTLENNIYLAWSLAVAMAAVLVVMAALLSELNWNLADAKFCTVLAVTVGLTIVSGSIQGAAYADHAGWAGWLLGFALPGLGELGLALAISAYNRSLDGREVTEAQRQLATGVRSHLVSAIANVDKSIIEKQVNRAVATVTKELVDSVVADMVTELRSNRAHVVAEIDARPVAEIEAATVKLPAPVDTAGPEIGVKNGAPILAENCQTTSLIDTRSFAERMADARRKKTVDRQNTLYDILRNEFAGAASDDVNKSELAERLGVSRQTVIKDFEALEAGQRISVNGHVAIIG